MGEKALVSDLIKGLCETVSCYRSCADVLYLKLAFADAFLAVVVMNVDVLSTLMVTLPLMLEST